jgi:hypothetical protein
MHKAANKTLKAYCDNLKPNLENLTRKVSLLSLISKIFS